MLGSLLLYTRHIHNVEGTDTEKVTLQHVCKKTHPRLWRVELLGGPLSRAVTSAEVRLALTSTVRFQAEVAVSTPATRIPPRALHLWRREEEMVGVR